MSEIKALDKLRNWKCEGHSCAAMRTCADEIQAEVDERFMERPCDKNGEPTYIGQRIKHRGHEGEVWLLGKALDYADAIHALADEIDEGMA